MTEGSTKTTAKSIRISTETAARVEAHRQPEESNSRVYERILIAGLDALEDNRHGEDHSRQDAKAEPDPSGYIDLLRQQNDFLREQISIKDAQIAGLSEIAKAAQTLHGLETTKAIQPAPASERRGIFARLFGRK